MSQTGGKLMKRSSNNNLVSVIGKSVSHTVEMRGTPYGNASKKKERNNNNNLC